MGLVARRSEDSECRIEDSEFRIRQCGDESSGKESFEVTGQGRRSGLRAEGVAVGVALGVTCG